MKDKFKVMEAGYVGKGNRFFYEITNCPEGVKKWFDCVCCKWHMGIKYNNKPDSLPAKIGAYADRPKCAHPDVLKPEAPKKCALDCPTACSDESYNGCFCHVDLYRCPHFRKEYGIDKGGE